MISSLIRYCTNITVAMSTILRTRTNGTTEQQTFNYIRVLQFNISYNWLEFKMPKKSSIISSSMLSLKQSVTSINIIIIIRIVSVASVVSSVIRLQVSVMPDYFLLDVICFYSASKNKMKPCCLPKAASTAQRWSALKLHNLHIHMRKAVETRPL